MLVLNLACQLLICPFYLAFLSNSVGRFHTFAILLQACMDWIPTFWLVSVQLFHGHVPIFQIWVSHIPLSMTSKSYIAMAPWYFCWLHNLYSEIHPPLLLIIHIPIIGCTNTQNAQTTWFFMTVHIFKFLAPIYTLPLLGADEQTRFGGWLMPSHIIIWLIPNSWILPPISDDYTPSTGRIVEIWPQDPRLLRKNMERLKSWVQMGPFL
jgi:hypothetical protein